MTGVVCEGCPAEAVAADDCASGWSPAPAKWRSKRKNVVNIVAGCKTGRLETRPSAADNSDSEEGLSDCSEMSHSQMTTSQEHKLYPEKMFKVFLQQTKGMKGLNLEKHFPDKLNFYNSAKHLIRNRATSELTDQEIFRLKKQMIKVRKQLSF